MTDEPKDPKDNVVQLVTKKTKEITESIKITEEVFVRKQRCWFKNNYGEKCTCQYCIYLGMLSQRIYELMVIDMHHQARRGSMTFSTQDQIDLVQTILEKIVAYDEQKQKDPKK